MTPTLSALIATYNGRAFIERTLDSVFAQTVPPFEVIVVDDCSTDGTAALVAERYPQVRLIALEHNGGGASAYNIAAEAARGDILGFLDHDDVWWPNWVARQTEALSAHPLANWSCTDVLVQMDDGRRGEVQHRTYPSQDAFLRAILNWDAIVVTMSALAVRRSVFAQLGKLDPAFRTMFDLDLYLRLSDLGGAHCVGSIQCTKHQHGGNLFMSNGYRNWYEDAIQFLDRFFADPKRKAYAALEPESRERVEARWAIAQRRAARLRQRA